jgi:hypothetical protein
VKSLFTEGLGKRKIVKVEVQRIYTEQY